MRVAILVLPIVLFSLSGFASAGGPERVINDLKEPCFVSVVAEDGRELKSEPSDPNRYSMDFRTYAIAVSDKHTGSLLYQVRPTLPNFQTAVSRSLGRVFSVQGNVLVSQNSSSGSLLAETALGLTLNTPVMGKDERYLFVTAGHRTDRASSGILYVIDPATLKVVTEFSLGQMPSTPTAGPGNRYLYIPQYYGDLTIVDTETLQVSTIKTEQGYPSWPIMSPDQTKLYWIWLQGGINVLDMTVNRLVKSVGKTTPELPLDNIITLSPDGKRLFITSSGREGEKRFLIVVDTEKLMAS